MSQVTLPEEISSSQSFGPTRAADRFWPLIRFRWGAVSILFAFALANLVVSPLFESPMIDDWSYALTVQRLVEDYQGYQPGWSAVTLISQILWGALFSLPFGFSFSALHLSTMVLSLAGLFALYGIGREVGLGEAKSTLLALTLFVNPIYFGLSYTFMTDIPSTSLSTVALWLYAVAVRKHSLRWWLLGSIACALAFLSRQTAVFVGLGAAAWLVSQRAVTPAVWRHVAAAVGLPFLAALGFGLWLRYGSGMPEGFSYNVAELAKLPPAIGARNVMLLIPVSFLYLGLFSLPYLAGLLPGARGFLSSRTLGSVFLALSATAAMTLLMFGWFGWNMPYLRYGPMLGLGGIGPNDLLGDRPTILDGGRQVALTLLAGAGAAALVAVGVSRIRARWLWGSSPIGLLGFVALAQLSWLLFGYLYLWDWILFDRYYLPVLTPLLLLLAAATRNIPWRWTLAAPLILLSGLFSLAGTHDWIAYRQAAWSGAQTLVDQGVPLRSIDAGFEWDGWQLYEFSRAHPEEWHHSDASPFWIGRRVAPVITSEYVVSFSPLDGYSVVETIPYVSWLAARRERLYVLHLVGE